MNLCALNLTISHNQKQCPLVKQSSVCYIYKKAYTRFITQRIMKNIFMPFLLGVFLSTLPDEPPFEMPSKPIIIMETTQGTIEMLLLPEIAPLAVQSFIRLAQSGKYDQTPFHRIVRGFVIQSGDWKTKTGKESVSAWNHAFKDECSTSVQFDTPGKVAMANKGPNTNGSQFFITVAPASHLNGNHTIFAKVVKGLEVVHKINESQPPAWKFWANPEPQMILRVYLLSSTT